MKKIASYLIVFFIATIIVSSGYNIASHVPVESHNTTFVKLQIEHSLQRLIDPLFE